jgi:hypothetical protein
MERVKETLGVLYFPALHLNRYRSAPGWRAEPVFSVGKGILLLRVHPIPSKRRGIDLETAQPIVRGLDSRMRRNRDEWLKSDDKDKRQQAMGRKPAAKAQFERAERVVRPINEVGTAYIHYVPLCIHFQGCLSTLVPCRYASKGTSTVPKLKCMQESTYRTQALWYTDT